VPGCIDSRKGSPPVIDHLCKECDIHFERLQKTLKMLKVPHTINPNLVRGLDYYTKTAFEVSSENLGSQSAVAAGGRYDSMVDEFDGPPTPGIGFAMGMERIIPLVKESVQLPAGPDLFLCPLGNEATEKALVLAEELRDNGLWAEVNYDGTSLRSQMRKANRIAAKHVIVLGDDELKSGSASMKDMTGGQESKTDLNASSLLNLIRKNT
jgi:histidyl-tRNA synthetase